MLEATKGKVLKEAEKRESLPEAARDKFLLKAAGQDIQFYNTSPMDLSKLGSTDIESNLLNYVQCFSRDAREIFEHFRFDEFVHALAGANLLFKVVQRVATMDLHPETVDDHEMGIVFEELIRKFAESSNETAGEHFTPRDIVRLTTSLVFMEDDDALRESGIIRTLYDPTVGTGGFLSSGIEYLLELNPGAKLVPFGQELNPESYAICKGDMLVKNQPVANIKLGNTLSDDQLFSDRFDYMLSNPPFGVDWKKIEEAIKKENKVKGFDGRFGPGLPRVSDGSLLFLLHLISKMRDYDANDPDKNGGRIGIILNGSPLFTGGAGSGESEIRRYLLEHDLLEAIIALPTDMFNNTGIATYVWVLSNKKSAERRGKVQLINAVHCYQKMRKSLGSKRQYVDDEQIALITKTFGAFEPVDTYALDPDEAAGGTSTRRSSKKADKRVFGCKIFERHAFGYRRITIERPLRLSAQFSSERLAVLRFDKGKTGPAMQRLYEAFGEGWDDESYGDFSEIEGEARSLIKAEFAELKEKQIKDVLSVKVWRAQKELLEKAEAVAAAVGDAQQHERLERVRGRPQGRAEEDGREPRRHGEEAARGPRPSVSSTRRETTTAFGFVLVAQELMEQRQIRTSFVASSATWRTASAAEGRGSRHPRAGVSRVRASTLVFASRRRRICSGVLNSSTPLSTPSATSSLGQRAKTDDVPWVAAQYINSRSRLYPVRRPGSQTAARSPRGFLTRHAR